MHKTKKMLSIPAGALFLSGTSLPAMTVDMTFFIASAGPGNGANLGELEGADRHRQTLAAAAGAGKHKWRACLSTQTAALNEPNVVHARNRISSGPGRRAGCRDMAIHVSRRECAGRRF